jgi:hypothetical protein
MNVEGGEREKCVKRHASRAGGRLRGHWVRGDFNEQSSLFERCRFTRCDQQLPVPLLL